MEPLVYNCRFKVRVRQKLDSAIVTLTKSSHSKPGKAGCSFWFVQFLQRQCKSQVQLPSLSSGVAQSLPQPPHFSQLSTFGPPPTFNFRPPPPSDRQEVQLSAERGLPVIRVGILLCTSYLCKCLLLWQDQIYNFSGRCHAFNPFCRSQYTSVRERGVSPSHSIGCD